MSENMEQISHGSSSAAPYEPLFESLYARPGTTSTGLETLAADATAFRRKSLKDLLAQGIPSRKSEAYKYFSLRSLFPLKSLSAPAALSGVENAGEGELKTVLRQAGPGFAKSFWAEGQDVRHLAEWTLLNGNPTGSEQQAFALGDAITVKNAPAWAEWQTPDKDFDPFTASIFTIFSEKTLTVKIVAVGEKNDAPRKLRLSVRHLLALAKAQSFLVSHVVLKLEAGLQLELIWEASEEQMSLTDEALAGAHQIFERMSFELAPGSHLSACFDLAAIPEAFRFIQLEARVTKGARLDLLSLVSGLGRLRVNTLIELVGDEAVANVWGMAQTKGSTVIDHHTEIRHLATKTSSTQSYKAIAGNESRCVFDGCIRVAPGVSQIDARQRVRGMLLSSEAEIDVKPQLRIDADDVKCSHGASIGGMDPEQIFYLRSRGLNQTEAVNLLTQGFVADLVDVESSPFLARYWRERLLFKPNGIESTVKPLKAAAELQEKEL